MYTDLIKSVQFFNYVINNNNIIGEYSDNTFLNSETLNYLKMALINLEFIENRNNDISDREANKIISQYFPTNVRWQFEKNLRASLRNGICHSRYRIINNIVYFNNKNTKFSISVDNLQRLVFDLFHDKTYHEILNAVDLLSNNSKQLGDMFDDNFKHVIEEKLYKSTITYIFSASVQSIENMEFVPELIDVSDLDYFESNAPEDLALLKTSFSKKLDYYSILISQYNMELYNISRKKEKALHRDYHQYDEVVDNLNQRKAFFEKKLANIKMAKNDCMENFELVKQNIFVHDASSFFMHIRNSLVHELYEIRLDDIVFRDYNPNGNLQFFSAITYDQFNILINNICEQLDSLNRDKVTSRKKSML